LLTGRNHHQSGNGTITELSTGFPGYHSIWGKDVASVAEVLRQNGYATGAWGKWHNTPDWETSPIGPFERWPTGLGFEYFYGFHGGETSQWEPQLVRNTTPVEPTRKPEQGYHLTEDLTDDAVAWVARLKSIAPDKPFFLYFATGAYTPRITRRRTGSTASRGSSTTAGIGCARKRSSGRRNSASCQPTRC
jgi:arylsulfatase